MTELYSDPGHPFHSLDPQLFLRPLVSQFWPLVSPAMKLGFDLMVSRSLLAPKCSASMDTSTGLFVHISFTDSANFEWAFSMGLGVRLLRCLSWTGHFFTIWLRSSYLNSLTSLASLIQMGLMRVHVSVSWGPTSSQGCKASLECTAEAGRRGGWK